jgi:pimeloyl-ACP methyl ester carboxylesterase
MRATSLLSIAFILACSACERRAPASSEPVRPAPSEPSERGSEPAARPEAPAALATPVEVQFPTQDHFVVHGTLYPGAEPTAGAVVLVHQLGSARGEWGSLVEALREAPALTVLAIDLRGHGASSADAEGHAVSYGDFDAEAWAATQNDVTAAVDYLRSSEAPVHPRRIALVGASIGATAVVRAAAEDRSLDVIATLSPGRAYRGVDSILVAVHMGERSYLGLAAREETDSVETAEALARITGGRTELIDGRAHGVALLSESTELAGILTRFLRESLERPISEAARAALPAAAAVEGAQ